MLKRWLGILVLLGRERRVKTMTTTSVRVQWSKHWQSTGFSFAIPWCHYFLLTGLTLRCCMAPLECSTKPRFLSEHLLSVWHRQTVCSSSSFVNLTGSNRLPLCLTLNSDLNEYDGATQVLQSWGLPCHGSSVLQMHLGKHFHVHSCQIDENWIWHRKYFIDKGKPVHVEHKNQWSLNANQ